MNILSKAAILVTLLLGNPLMAVEALLTDDTNTNTARPAVNFGAGRTMILRTGQSAFMKFDLSTLPAGTLGAGISKATLKVWVDRVVKAGAYDVFPVAAPWTEGTLKASALPALGAAEYTGINLPLASARKYLTVDLTDLVKDWVDGTLPNHGIALAPSVPSPVFAFLSSKEDVATGHLPELEITLAPTVAVPFSTVGSSASSGISVENSGSGAAVEGVNSSPTGLVAGLVGKVSSTTGSIGPTVGVSGVYGEVSATSPGDYSAALRGVNKGLGSSGVGVSGYHGCSGWGVYGETPSGYGVYGVATDATSTSAGVLGETRSLNGAGVIASYSGDGDGVALAVDNGAIRLTGVNKPAFLHTATIANKVSNNGTEIDHPMCNGDANALLFVTHYLGAGNQVHYNNSPLGVYYDPARARWQIANENLGLDPQGSQFFVLVIKQ